MNFKDTSNHANFALVHYYSGRDLKKEKRDGVEYDRALTDFVRKRMEEYTLGRKKEINVETER